MIRYVPLAGLGLFISTYAWGFTNIPDLKIFSGKGGIYLNATRSQAVGEEYLLNQQLSSIKYVSDFRLNPQVNFHSAFIYNPFPNPVNPEFYFDEAFLEYKNGTSPWRIMMGKSWIPFVKNKNNLIYKPYTKALGQTNEAGLEIRYERTAYARLSLFSPHTDISQTRLPFCNLNVGVQSKETSIHFDVGVNYLFSLAESQLFQYNKGFGGFLGKSIKSYVPGVSFYTHLEYKKMYAHLSYVTAVQKFLPNEVSYQRKGAQPRALSLHGGYEFRINPIPASFHLLAFYDRSFQALALKLPKERVGSGLNINPSSRITIQLQYSKEYNYAKGIVASGLNKKFKGDSKKTHLIALQCVLHF